VSDCGGAWYFEGGKHGTMEPFHWNIAGMSTSIIIIKVSIIDLKMFNLFTVHGSSDGNNLHGL
jgi:hypothetical protein